MRVKLSPLCPHPILRRVPRSHVVTMGNTNGVSLPYDLGNTITDGGELWQLYEGTKRGGDKAPVTVFMHNGAPDVHPHAKNAMAQLKMTRHPNVLRFIVRAARRSSLGGTRSHVCVWLCVAVCVQEGTATEKQVLLVTEPVVPLKVWLERHAAQGDDDSSQGIEAQVAWGLASIAKALDFLAKREAAHLNISPTSVFVTKAGEWKLGGFELCAERAAAQSSLASLRRAMTPECTPPENGTPRCCTGPCLPSCLTVALRQTCEAVCRHGTCTAWLVS